MIISRLASVARALRNPGRRGLSIAALTALCALAAGACHLLDVSNPDVVPTDNLNNPLALPTIRAGAIGDFTLGYSGSGASGSAGTVEGQIMISGLLGDEWINTETFPDRVQADARQVDPSSATFSGVFRNLARARLSTRTAADRFRALSDTTTSGGLAEMLTLNGYTYIFFAENYCSGVPISSPNPDGTVNAGLPLTTTQFLDTAIARFNEALGAAQALTSVSAKAAAVAFASVGKARAFLDEGRDTIADTLASAANVPTGFVYLVQHDLNTRRQNDGVYNAIRAFKRYGVADREGGVGFPWMFVQDPRTPFTRFPATNKGFDGATPQFDQLRYVDEKASVTVGTGLEARLINAEAALQRGDTAGYMAQLNGLRSAPPAYILAGVINAGVISGTTPSDQPKPLAPMTALATPTTPAAAVDLLFAERARWLWGTSHRLNDMRRLVRAVGVRGGFGRPVNSVFPNGLYFKNGLSYGNDVNYPVPLDELNNPNFTQCLDRLP